VVGGVGLAQGGRGTVVVEPGDACGDAGVLAAAGGLSTPLPQLYPAKVSQVLHAQVVGLVAPSYIKGGTTCTGLLCAFPKASLQLHGAGAPGHTI